MKFRPCIDLREGRVVQIVGGSLRDDEGRNPVVNFMAERSCRRQAGCSVRWIPTFGLLFEFDRPVGMVQELLPRLVALVAQVNADQWIVSWLDGLLNEMHARLLGRSSAFEDITVRACADDISPDCLAPHCSWYHMVER